MTGKTHAALTLLLLLLLGLTTSAEKSRSLTKFLAKRKVTESKHSNFGSRTIEKQVSYIGDELFTRIRHRNLGYIEHRRRYWKDSGKGKGDWGKGKGSKSKSGGDSYYSKSSKGSGKGKGGKGGGSKGSKGSKGGSSSSLENFCRDLDFSGFYGNYGPGNGGDFFLGKGKGGGKAGHKSSSHHHHDHRSLVQASPSHGRQTQFDGFLCSPNALEVASMNPNLSIFVDLIHQANLEKIFLCPGPFTVLAPSNAAFKENPDLLAYLLSPKKIDELQEVLLYHIIPGLFLTDDLVAGPIQSLLGDDIDVGVNPVTFNQAGVVDPDILACNGALNIIDDVLIPPDSPVLPEICEILDFRMDDQFPRIAGASRVGRVYKGAHRSLGDNTQLQRALQYDGERCSLNALDTMRLDPDLSKFVDLLEAAGLEDIFLCAGPFTVFAPTNEAFRSITPSIMRELLRPENQETLQQLLLYHMVPGYIPSSDLQAGPIETLLFGYSVDIAVDPFMVNDANILEPDLDACNGVIHTIDDVLVPETEDICDDYTFDDGSTEGQDCEPNVLEIARENPNFSVIVTLIEHVGLKDIFSCAGPFTALLPNNAAFDNLDPAYVDYLLLPENKQELEDVLLYHFLPGSTPVDDFTQGPAETLLAGATVEVTTSPIQFNNASVVNADDPACNGLVNEIDQVLLPFDFPTPDVTAAPTAAPIDPRCSQYTFSRRQLQNGGANCEGNIFDTALEDPNFQIITSMFLAAELDWIFKCPGPFTAQFPDNEAFNSVDPEFADFLLDPANVEDLKNLLLFHLLPGATLSSDLPAGLADTLFPSNPVDIAQGPLEFDGNGVITADIEACNGYINKISGVLNPFQLATPPPTGTLTLAPTMTPTALATPAITTLAPTPAATANPTTAATTIAPTAVPTQAVATVTPTAVPTPAATTIAPTAVPTPAATNATTQSPGSIGPTPTPVQTVRVADFYISFIAEGADREPTDEEYEAVVNSTNAWFESYLSQTFADNPDEFPNVELLYTFTEPDFTEFGDSANVPADLCDGRCNILVVFKLTDFSYTVDSLPPDPSVTFELMREAISPEYILEAVRPLEGTPFESTTEVFFGYSVDIPRPVRARNLRDLPLVAGELYS